ncbi:hypothetical protein IE81DRAFT_295457 [Ceraceosorus guamensis]|uniref:CLASP N-terminal domain-containing protein n=1 Tax=Ceraceosorus guamensis TaxID=1522189 RepID=A0A316VN86_9BASI|nr:hypothetical protein IE81DRAFT_295457 [Ceraceosorus guamensis]PWN39027.1 hypothetical protein IE81DRAFT_295457 [Ceraceosorus guamensis]
MEKDVRCAYQGLTLAHPRTRTPHTQPAIAFPRQVSDNASLRHHFDDLSIALAEPETESSWQRLDRALLTLEAITKGGAYKLEEYVPRLKAIAHNICDALLSDRSKLSGTAADLLNSVAPRLADRFDSLVSSFLPSLLQLCARTNKVQHTRARKTLLLIAKHCRLSSLLPLLRESSRDKSNALRSACVECAAVLLESCEGDAGRIGRRVAEVELLVKNSATDANVEVRGLSKRLFGTYVILWPQRVER